jgi:WD40 repeat protein
MAEVVEPPYGIIWNLLKAGKVVPFLGAGASLIGRLSNARWNPNESTFLLSDRELAHFLAKEAMYPSTDPLDRDDLAKVWDADSGEELFTLRGHVARVFSVVFSPDGKYLATASEAQSVRIFILDIKELITLARTHITCSLTPEECQKYLNQEQCPPIP